MTVLAAAPIIDPNWLLSSTAQSAAAMVAIIGGFLVSRLVSLSADRNAILQRLEDLGTRRALKADEHREVRDERFAVTKRWFINDRLKEVVAHRGMADPESLLDRIGVGSSLDEMRPVAQHLLAAVQAAFALIEARYTGASIPPPTAEGLRRDGLTIPAADEEIYEGVASSIGEGRPRTPNRLYPVMPLPSVKPAIVYQRQDDRVARERELRSELRFLDKELMVTVERLASFEKPKGITGAVLALTYLAVAGVLLPVVLMAFRPVPDNSVSRVIVVLAFTSGLLVLLFYFIGHARSFRPRKGIPTFNGLANQ